MTMERARGSTALGHSTRYSKSCIHGRIYCLYPFLVSLLVLHSSPAPAVLGAETGPNQDNSATISPDNASMNHLFSVVENLKNDLLKRENRNYPGDDVRLSPLETVFARHSYRWEKLAKQTHDSSETVGERVEFDAQIDLLSGDHLHANTASQVKEVSEGSANDGISLENGRNMSDEHGLKGTSAGATNARYVPRRALAVTQVTKSRSPPPAKKKFIKKPPPPIRRRVGATRRPPPAKKGGTKQSPIPTCSGPCCSGAAPKIPAGVPVMPSVWASNQMAQGAQIQVRSKAFGTWWRPAKGLAWTSVIASFDTTQPASSVFLTINRIDGNKVQFKTPSGTYMRASRTLKYGKNYLMDTTTDATDLSTIFTVVYKTGSPYVAFRASDNLYLSTEGNRLMRWSATASDWEFWTVWEVMNVPAIRGVNLGSWLVFEQWMNPNGPQFQGTLDGTAFRFKSVTTGNYMTAPGGGGSYLKCNEVVSNVNQIFHIRTVNSPQAPYIWNMMVQNFQWWQILPGSSNIWATSGTKDPPTDGSANFECIWDTTWKYAVFRAPNGNFLRATSDGNIVADFQGNAGDPSIWESAAAFEVSWVSWINTDWQLARSSGSSAKTVLDALRAQFITESDWQYMADQKINAVRVPVGYWIYDSLLAGSVIPTGTVAFLDWAFQMANKYNVRIWFSVHAAPGSQGGSNGRDGMVKWGTFDTVNQTLSMVNFLAGRYASNPMWLGMGLLNEPVVPGFNGIKGVDKNVLIDYYTKAYDVIRYYSPCAFVSMEGRVWSTTWEVHWVMWDIWHRNLMLETHIYDVFDTTTFAKMTPQQEVQYVRNNRPAQIKDLQQFGRALLVGEWSNAMAKFPPDSDLQTLKDFGRAQLEAFATSKVGWFFWSLKINSTGAPHWDWYKSTSNGWLPKKSDGNWW